MTQWLSQWVTRSPIELFWTSRNSSQFDNYFENNKNYSSLSDSKKVCISNILKTQGAKIVFTNLELLIEFKSKCFWSIRFWFVRKSIHVNLWILIWFDGGSYYILYFIFYILPGIAGARYFCTKYWDWDRNINNKDRNTYVGADQGERWWKLNHLGEHLRMQSGEKPTKYLLAHF